VTFRGGNVRQAGRDVVEGAMGPYASRLAGLFLYNAVDGTYQPNAHVPLGEPTSYDIELGELGPHEASPMAARGTYRLASLLVTFRFVTKIPPNQLHSKPPQTDHDIRDIIAAGITERLDLIAQSLATPECVTYTAAAEPTGIISGLMRSPDGNGFPEVSAGVWEWGTPPEPRRVTHEIRARAIVQIDRA
jgi:hypothetical protein